MKLNIKSYITIFFFFYINKMFYYYCHQLYKTSYTSQMSYTIYWDVT